jgi:hypothetical protein
MTKRRKDSIVEDIKHHFGFLFDKGYQLRDVRYFQESFVIKVNKNPLIRWRYRLF